MYGSELVSDPPREPTSSIAIDYNFQRITSNERGICEIPLINTDFADAGSLIFAGPTAFSLKKKKQFQGEVDTFRGITEFDLSASKEGSVNFLIRVPKAQPRNLKSRTIVYFTENICYYGWIVSQKLNFLLILYSRSL